MQTVLKEKHSLSTPSISQADKTELKRNKSLSILSEFKQKVKTKKKGIAFDMHSFICL